jgi:type I restriction enzyme S subunit
LNQLSSFQTTYASLTQCLPTDVATNPSYTSVYQAYQTSLAPSGAPSATSSSDAITIMGLTDASTISTYTTEEVDDKYRLKQNDLLIGMDGNFHLNFWDKDGAYLNQRSVRIRAKKDSEISNLQAYFELKPYIKARENNVSRTTVGHLSDKDLKRLFLISPSRSDLFKPKNLFENSLSEIISNRLQNQKLTELRDWLLPMLMNGQVKVN